MRQHLGGVAVKDEVGDAVIETLDQFLTQGLKLGEPLGHFQTGHFSRHAQADDTHDIFGAGPFPVFLDAALDEGPDAGAPADIERPHAVGTVELVGRQAEQVHLNLFDIDGNDARGRHGIGVKGHFPGLGDLADVGDGLDRADFVVGHLDGDQDGLVGDGLFHGRRVHQAVGIHIQGGYFIVHQAEGAQGVENGLVFDIGGDDVPAFFPLGKGHAFDGLVDGFGAPGGEDDVLGVGVEQGRGLVPGLIQGLCRGLAEAMIAGWIAEDIIHDMVHRLFYLGVERGGGVIVKIDHIHAAFLQRSGILMFMRQVGAAGDAKFGLPPYFPCHNRGNNRRRSFPGGAALFHPRRSRLYWPAGPDSF